MRAIRIAQHGFGAGANFASCGPAECPAPTRKSIEVVLPTTDNGVGAPITAPPPTALVTPDDNELRQPVAPPAPTTVAARDITPDRPALVVTFGFGSSELTPTDRDAIASAVSAARPIRRIGIVGRTDASGPPAVNDALARARAAAFERHLLRIEPALATKLETRSQGLCCYAASNDSAAGRAKNRRAEIVFERDGADL